MGFIGNILANIKSPSDAREIFRKTYYRLFPEKDSIDVISELNKHKTDFADWAIKIDPEAYEIALGYQEQHQTHLARIADKIEISMGGSAHLTLLYFLVTAFKPKIVVETGVAAGHSSRALLAALTQFQPAGKLYSSDFPYLKEKQAKDYIGIVVEQDLRANWTLLIEGDRANLPKINAMIGGKIDLFHYDSDKTRNGRNFALECLRDKLEKGSMIVFDDIQDNDHFLNWSKEHPDRKIFEINGKFVGLVVL